MNYVPTNSKYISNFTAWEEQKRFVNFTAKDVASLKKLHPLAIKYADMFVEELYQHLMQFSELSRFLSDEKVLHRLKLAQKQYFIDLTSGEYDEELSLIHI